MKESFCTKWPAGCMQYIHHMIVRMFNKPQRITSFAKAMKTAAII